MIVRKICLKMSGGRLSGLSASCCSNGLCFRIRMSSVSGDLRVLEDFSLFDVVRDNDGAEELLDGHSSALGHDVELPVYLLVQCLHEFRVRRYPRDHLLGRGV